MTIVITKRTNTVPDGLYKVYISAAEEKPAASSTGSPYLEFTFTIIDSEFGEDYNGTEVRYQKFSLSPKAAFRLVGSTTQLGFLEALLGESVPEGESIKFEPEDLLDKEVVVRFGTKDYTKKDGTPGKVNEAVEWFNAAAFHELVETKHATEAVPF